MKNIIRIVEFDNCNSLLLYLNQLGDRYFYRGMANSDWKLKTSINRFLDDLRNKTNNPLLSDTNQNVQAEFLSQVQICKRQSEGLNRVFGRSSDEAFTINEETFIFLQVVLQHYEFPTRLLDWAKNYNIALYFCIEDTTQSGDIAIWAISKNKIRNVEESISDNTYLYESVMFENNKLVKFYQRLKPAVYLLNTSAFSRINAQEGVEIVTGASDYMDFQDHLLEDRNFDKDDIVKVIINESLRSEIVDHITKLGLNRVSLYPDDITDGYLKYDKSKLEEIMLKTYINWKP